MEIFRHINEKYSRVAVTLFETKVFKISIHFHENYHGHGIPPVWKRIKRQTFTGKLSAGTRVARIRALNSLPFRLLDTRFDESSSWRGWLSREQRSRPVYLTRASDLERKKRTTEIQGGFFFFFTNVEPRPTFISDYPAIQFLSTSAVVFQDCVTWRDFVYFSRENLDITGVYVCVCFLSFFLFGILRPRENNVSAPRERLFFEDWVTARITWTIYAHHAGNSFQGRWSFDFRAKGHPLACPSFSFRPIRSNNCGERRGKRWSFLFYSNYFVRFEEIPFSTMDILYSLFNSCAVYAL